MKNILMAIVFLSISKLTEAQNTINNNGGSTPVSNTTLPSAVSNSNNSNSGVNPNGNPGTILNSTSNSSSAGFQTPTPPIQPGIILNSSGNNAVIPSQRDYYNSSKAKTDSVRLVQSVKINSNSTVGIPKLTEQEKKAHIDSMIRAIDRRQTGSNTKKTAVKPAVKKVRSHF